MPILNSILCHEIHLRVSWLSEVVADETWLSLDERRRSFSDEALRQQFIKSRWLLRTILSDYTGITPEKLRFQMGWQGKPSLHGIPLRFNQSHSQGCYVLAISADQEIGVDVEAVRPVIGVSDDPETYIRAWVRKEAVVKGTGTGLSDEPPSGWHVYERKIDSTHWMALAYQYSRTKILLF